MLKQLINGEESPLQDCHPGLGPGSKAPSLKTRFQIKSGMTIHSFIFHGFSVFTTFLSFDKKPFFLQEHLNRLQVHARELGLNYPGHGAFLSDLNILLPLDRLLRIRLSVGPNLRIAEATSYILPPQDYYTQGVKAICTQIQVHPQLAHLKTGNYLPYLMAKQKAEQENAFEGLLIDHNQHIVDGSRNSPLLYQNNTLTICQGGLDGITRNMVVKKAIELGIQIKHQYVKASQLHGQLLLAGSGIGLVPVGTPCDQNIANLVRIFSPRRQALSNLV